MDTVDKIVATIVGAAIVGLIVLIVFIALDARWRHNAPCSELGNVPARMVPLRCLPK